MELGQLETFLAIAREKSFSRAAERLYRTQPAISLALKRLEEELGESLVDRTTKGGTLTDAGETLLPLAQRMLDLRQEIRETFGALRGLHQGRLIVGANESMSIHLLPALLLAFQARHPGIKIQAHRLTSERIPAEVLERRMDVGFLSFEPRHPELEAEVVYRDKMVLVVPPRNRFAGKGPVDLKDLGGEDFIAHNALTPTRQAIVDLFARHEVPLRTIMELGTLSTIQDFVALGKGLAILPRLTVRESLQSGRLVEVSVRELDLDKPIYMIRRRENALSHPAKAFLDLVHAHELPGQSPAPGEAQPPRRKGR
ncbi:MAG: LysR family transcriptional regulator [Acidobacteria bacterium]|nr:LysR family transcriptional regulator [Acidobacteriota bacterium]